MKIFVKCKDLTESEAEIYYKENAKKNSYYMITLSIALAVIETLILIYGFINKFQSKGIVTIMLLTFYGAIIITALSFLPTMIKLRKNIDKHYKKILVLTIVYAFLMLLIGDIITNLDNIHELNSNNIIVSLIVILGFSTIVYLPLSIYPVLLVFNFLALLIPDLIFNEINYNNITYINLTIYSITAYIGIFIHHLQSRRQIISKIMVNTQTEQLKALNNQLLIQAKTDGLTNLYNRSYFNVRFKELWDEAVIDNKIFNTVLIDIDNFKSINDTYGHLVGDKCLRKIAKLIKEESDKIDGLSFRYGGEEFLIVALDIEEQALNDAMETLRTRVNQISLFEDQANVSISIGISSNIAFQSKNCFQVLAESDEALYYAKDNGKNQVINYKNIEKNN